MWTHTYRERDYPFGQTMLILRTAMHLTQAGLAQSLGSSRAAVLGWEAGSSYPKAEHLKRFIVLAVQLRAFPAGREGEEIRALWHAAHQKVLLDEPWLSALLGERPHAPAEGTSESCLPEARPAPDRRVEWDEAMDVPSFYGRKQELASLSQWVVQERCQVVSVLGMGGIGKSALAVTLMYRVAEHFEVVLFRSLCDAPSCETWLSDCLQVLSPQPLVSVPRSLQGRLSLLLMRLRERRALLVLDNLEALLQEGDIGGHYRPGYEGYGHVLRRVGETTHQSCLLVTSREKPTNLVPLEGTRSPVRALRLSGLEQDACEQLLAEKEVVGTPQEWARLAQAYAGNPLALKVVAETIADLFAGEIGLFLKQGTTIFGGIGELLAEQVSRLSALEQTVLRTLAIAREPQGLEELLARLFAPLPVGQLLSAVENLRRRSLIEPGKLPGSVTLQSVVLEYVTGLLIEEVASEIAQGRLLRLIEHGLCQAGAREDVRQTQDRLIVAPILARLRGMYSGRADVEEHLLAQLRERDEYVQGVEMQDASLAGATCRDTIFTEAFDVAWAVATSLNGQYWATGSRHGEVRVWREEGRTLHLVWQAHTDTVSALAFSPDDLRLASGSADGTITLWELERGTPLWTVGHTSSILSLAFAPDGRALASSSGNDAAVRLWDAKGWSPDGETLASSGWDNAIRLWDPTSGACAEKQRDSDNPDNSFFGMAWSPDGQRLAV